MAEGAEPYRSASRGFRPPVRRLPATEPDAVTSPDATDDVAVADQQGLPERERIMRITQAIEAEIIPRLALAHAGYAWRDPHPVELTPAPDADALEALIIAGAVDEAERRMTGALAAGVPIEHLVFKVIEPTARRLGERWEDDTLGFAEVTLGLCGLQDLLRRMDHLFDGARRTGEVAPRAVLASTPGEGHELGLVVVEQFLRRDGFDVTTLFGADEREIMGELGRAHCDVVGFSLSREDLVPRLTRLVKAVRRSAQTTPPVVLVGGRVFAECPELVESVGADGMARDGRDAVRLARSLVRERRHA